MGAKGIRRRKPYRRLPPARLPSENDVIPPHIMWPGADSGFEAASWTPAGRSQEGMRFLLGLKRGRGRPFAMVFVWAALAIMAVSVASYLLPLLLR